MGRVSDIKPPNKEQKVLDCSRVLPRRAVGAGECHPAHKITSAPPTPLILDLTPVLSLDINTV